MEGRNKNKSVNDTSRIMKLPPTLYTDPSSPIAFTPMADYEMPLTQQKLQKLQKANQNYNYNEPGSMAMAYRVPDNLVGKSLRTAHKQTQRINNELLSLKVDSFNQTAPSSNFSTINSNFPKTTN